jgi:hypothetical protein
MSEIDTLLFCDPDFVGREPTVDGFFDLDYMLTGETPEGGYIGGSELTIGASGIAPVVFRGIRKTSTNRLVLAFMCRFSHEFDANNAVVIVVKPTFGDSDPTHARKIIIKPVHPGSGAGTTPAPGPNEIKTGQDPVNVNFSRGVAPAMPGDPPTWALYFTQTNTTVKVRSWLPTVPSGSPPESAWSVEVELPTTAADGGGDWIDLGNDFGLFFSVIKIIPVEGGAATQYWFPAFNGAQVTGAVEVWTPTTYGHGIIPHVSGESLPPGQYPGVGFDDPWLGIGCRPVTAAPGSALSGTINGAGSPAGTPDNRIVAKVRNNSSTPANDITCEFRFHRYGLGPSDPLLWNSPPGLTPNPTPNRDGPTPDPAFNVPPNSTGNEVSAVWPKNDPSLAAVASQDTCMWAQLSARTPVTFFQSSTRRNMTFVNLSESDADAVVSGKGYDNPPDGSGDQDFIVETFARGVIVRELIEKRDSIDPALLPIVAQSLAGAERGAVAGVATLDHAMLSTHATGTSPYANSVVFIWQSFGYRVTADTITFGATTYPLLDNGCGSFGSVAHHEGVQDSFGWSFEGDRMVQYRPGLYGLKVPNGGETVIKFRLTAAPDGPRGDSASKLPPGKFTPPTHGVDPGHDDLPKGCLAFLTTLFKKS